MPRADSVQTAFLSGVLDPRASGRVETDAYQQGMLEGTNIVPVHLGGVRRRPGLGYRALLPNQLTRISSGITPTAPRGGTAANANDNDSTTLLTTTTNVGTLDPYIVVHYDLGSAKAVLFADVIGILSDGGSSTQFAIQYSTDDSAWTTLGSALPAIDTTERSYRRAGPVTAQYWRIAKIGGTDMGSVHITISDFNLWQDSGTVSEGREIGWEVSADERYVLVLTDRSGTIFDGDDGSFVDRCPMPYASADLAELDGTPNDEDAVFLTHEDYPPRFVVRESVTNMQTFEAEFTNVPQIDFNDADSPTPTTDVQIITFDANWTEGDTFQVSLDGAKTGAIAYAGDNSTTADNIAREVQKLWVVKSFSGVTCADTGTREFTVSFAEGSADAYGTATVTQLASVGASKGTATVNHSATGVSRREPLWSATRGYPRSCGFFEGRLFLGGTRSRQKSLIGSVVNDILQLDTGEGLDDDALFYTLNGQAAINGLYGGRSFQIFATGGELRYVKEQGVPIVPGDVPVKQTEYGSAKIRPVGIDGATIYVQRNRKSIRDYRFDYTENAYNSLGISSLAAHLIYDVRDLASWNGSAEDEINLVFAVNGTNPLRTDDAASEGVILDKDGDPLDPESTEPASLFELQYPHGSVAVFNTRKESNVQAWTIWTTKGEFKAVATVLREIFFLVKRTIDGVEGLYFEQADDDLYTDCAAQVTNSPASATVTGLDHLNGEECRVRADDFVFENVTPSAGSATLEETAEDIEIGLDWTPAVTPMPLQVFTASGSSNLMRKKRIAHVACRVRKTLGLLVNGRPLPDRYFDVDTLDAPATPFSGTHDLEESTNWDRSEDKLVRFTQVDPLPFELLAVDVQLEVTG